uniref:Uncharacterized protein n=1 Tax=Acanthochromis polyacanthus TaxID=80966 RepID=A0A3Q1GPF0_9TELE
MGEKCYTTCCMAIVCFRCIRQSLEDCNRCPKCHYIVNNVDQLYPNFLLCFLKLYKLEILLSFSCGLSHRRRVPF